MPSASGQGKKGCLLRSSLWVASIKGKGIEKAHAAFLALHYEPLVTPELGRTSRMIAGRMLTSGPSGFLKARVRDGSYKPLLEQW